MESRSNRSASPTSRTASTYNGFTFAVPPTPQLLRSADTSAPDLELGARPNETSSSGTLSTPYSSLIATPISGAGPITAQSRNERRTPVSPASQGSSGMVLRTASSRPPFAFFPPPESNHHGWTNPPTPLSQNSPSKAEESSVGDENQDEKFIRPTDTDMVPTAPGSSLSQSLHMIGEDDSPYPEVRASVANTDDPDMPTLTFRMWFIGITLCLVRTSLALFFSLRWPSPWISDTLVIFGLNPGPFNIKEHTLVFIMSFISDPPIYGFMLIVTAEKHYGTPLGTGFEFLFLFGTQLACLGSVAFGRSLFIYPASVIWPHSLVRSTLLNTLHADEETRNGQMTRYRLFIICAAVAFLYCFLPERGHTYYRLFIYGVVIIFLTPSLT
ncbi:hypothetical protein FRC04_004762 [Tulasnella sp. 424]|nr:hypothetical protein FRC04_004762 [Tulasnella sp. 424]